MSMRQNQDFMAYMENLHRFPYYTFLTPEEKAEFEEMDAPKKKMSLGVAKKHPFLWMKYACGIQPYDYQWKMLDNMYKHRRVAAVTSRQIGKSFVIGGFAFWAARNNVFPVGIDNRTKIGIVSKTEPQAKKLLKDIYKMIQRGDQQYAQVTKGTVAYQKQKFTEEMSAKTTLFKLEFPGGTIEIYPPTGRVRGESLSFLIIDEADWLNHEDPDYFFDAEAMPTLKKTDGSCFLFSTPKGLPSFFMEIINPESEKPARGWKRIWYPWTIYEDDWYSGWETRIDYLERGKELDFKVEYEASFASGRHSFFPPEVIDICVDKELLFEDSSHLPCTCAVDFGDTTARTVITIVTHDKERNKSRVLYQKEFEAGYENSNLPYFMRALRNRFNIQEVIPDDCVGGKTAIELLRRDGWNVKPFVFKSQKHEYYEYTRTAFANKRVELPYHPELIAQLKSIEESKTPMGNIQIKKPRGMNDDRCDSLVMALSPYTPPQKVGKRYVL